jgi:hypothetical protein
MARTVDPEHAEYCRDLNAQTAKERVADDRVRREDLLTTNELARLWGTSNQTIQRWRQYKVCNFPEPYFDDVLACLYLKQDLYAWLKSLGQAIKDNAPVAKEQV